jgi:hypothetical protein
MAEVSPELQRRYGLMIGSIPEAIRKAIGSEELTDRLVMAAGLMRESQAARSPADRRALGTRAARVLGARPRAETEQIVVAKMAKAKAIGDPAQAMSLERQARQELALNPPAVRRRRPGGRPVAKASANAKAAGGTLIAVYNQAGELVGVVDPAELTPVSSLADVTKAQRAARQATRSRTGR